MNKQRIGIYAGAFDPVHNGHIQLALSAMKHAALDKVYFLVEPQPRHKQGVKSFEHRVEMVRLATHAHPKLGVLMLGQERFTIHQTWPVIQGRFEGASLFMLMGSDVFSRLSHWPDLAELAASTTFVVSLRTGGAGSFHDHLATIEKIWNTSLKTEVFESDLPSVASRTIRGTLRSGRLSKSLDPKVSDYIIQNHLYRPA